MNDRRGIETLHQCFINCSEELWFLKNLRGFKGQKGLALNLLGDVRLNKVKLISEIQGYPEKLYGKVGCPWSSKQKCKGLKKSWIILRLNNQWILDTDNRAELYYTYKLKWINENLLGARHCALFIQIFSLIFHIYPVKLNITFVL